MKIKNYVIKKFIRGPKYLWNEVEMKLEYSNMDMSLTRIKQSWIFVQQINATKQEI